MSLASFLCVVRSEASRFILECHKISIVRLGLTLNHIAVSLLCYSQKVVLLGPFYVRISI